MPQFDFANVFWPQLIWLAIIFAVLFFGVVLPTLPKLGRVVTAREDKIAGDIATAEAAKAEADGVEEANVLNRASSQEKAREALAEAKAKAAKSVEKKVAAATAKLDEKMAAANADIEKARKKAMTQVEDIASDSAAQIVEKLTGKRPTPAATSKAAKAALALVGGSN
jgi:F-type H+-transporting ATPase subunit b